MRFPMLVACVIAAAGAGLAGAARATHAQRSPAPVGAIRSSVDHYRSVAWIFQRAANLHRTPTTYSYRRSTDPKYLRWTLQRWQQHEYDAGVHAIHVLRQKLGVPLSAGPGLHASLARRIAYSRALTLRLNKIYPGHAPATRTLADAGSLPPTQRLYRWQVKAAVATLTVSRHATHLSVAGPRWLTDAFTCIHGYEGAWNANSGNGYYGGLQMDYGFMSRYGADYERQWGTADRWPPWAQITAAVRAYQSGRGFWPWPNTARACGLL